MKRFLVALTFAALVGGPAAAATAPVAQPVASVRDMDIHAFIQQVARLTDMTFIVDSRVSGTVAAPDAEQVAKDELLDVFVSTLRASGVSAVPSVGGAYRIFPAADQVQRTSAALSVAGPVRL